VRGMRSFVSAKLHGLRVTGKSVAYEGSVSIDETFLALAGIDPYEQVHIVNLANGNRWVTYALPIEAPGVFTLNGGGARLGELGDECVVMAYRLEERFSGARVVFFDHANEIVSSRHYPPDWERDDLGDVDLSTGLGTPR
jgi:aspartate 1-decarboxylase